MEALHGAIESFVTRLQWQIIISISHLQYSGEQFCVEIFSAWLS